MAHTGYRNTRIMVQRSECYLSENWAFCVYFVQRAWAKKLKEEDLMAEGFNLPYTLIEPKKGPYKRPIEGIHGAQRGLRSPNHGAPFRRLSIGIVGIYLSILCNLLDPRNYHQWTRQREGRSLPYALIEPRNDPTKGPSRESMGHIGGYNPRIMVHHSKAHLTEKCALFINCVQDAWFKKLKAVDLITERCNLL